MSTITYAPSWIDPRYVAIRLRGWWLTRGRIKVLLAAAIFFAVSYTGHPIPAIILGVLLADFVLHRRGNWLLRVLIGWLIINMAYFALGGQL